MKAGKTRYSIWPIQNSREVCILWPTGVDVVKFKNFWLLLLVHIRRTAANHAHPPTKKKINQCPSQNPLIGPYILCKQTQKFGPYTICNKPDNSVLTHFAPNPTIQYLHTLQQTLKTCQWKTPNNYGLELWFIAFRNSFTILTTSMSKSNPCWSLHNKTRQSVEKTPDSNTGSGIIIHR